MRYITFLFIVSILVIIIGVITGKISVDNFSQISVLDSAFGIMQILVIVMILMLAIAMSLPALFIDLLLLVFTGQQFPLIGLTWDLVWDDVTIKWFWTSTSGSSLLVASVVLVILSFFTLRRKRRR